MRQYQSGLLFDDNRDVSEACETRPLVRACVTRPLVRACVTRPLVRDWAVS